MKLIPHKNITPNKPSKITTKENIIKKAFIRKIMFGEYEINKVKFTA